MLVSKVEVLEANFCSILLISTDDICSIIVASRRTLRRGVAAVDTEEIICLAALQELALVLALDLRYV